MRFYYHEGVSIFNLRFIKSFEINMNLTLIPLIDKIQTEFAQQRYQHGIATKS